MFEAILKILPKLTDADLKAMERSLQSRFTRVAKGFGRNLMKTLKGGGLAGAALALVNKIINPLKETNDAIERTLKTGSDLVTNAGQFGTSAGRLFKLTQLARSKGIDDDGLYMLLSKFQATVAENRADPTKGTAVANFTKETDTAKAFFDFIQSLKTLDKSQQVLVQQQVFGEKQVLKMASFLQTDFGKQIEKLGLGDTDEYTRKLTKIDRLSDKEDVLKTRREGGDLMAKSGLLSDRIIEARDKQEQINLQRERQRISAYENISMISTTLGNIMSTVEFLLQKAGELLIKVSNMEEYLKKFSASGLLRGIFGKKDK